MDYKSFSEQEWKKKLSGAIRVKLDLTLYAIRTQSKSKSPIDIPPFLLNRRRHSTTFKASIELADSATTVATRTQACSFSPLASAIKPLGFSPLILQSAGYYSGFFFIQLQFSGLDFINSNSLFQVQSTLSLDSSVFKVQVHTPQMLANIGSFSSSFKNQGTGVGSSSSSSENIRIGSSSSSKKRQLLAYAHP
ncbi:hypothetical protein LXL04_011120 [Taraxacum kok-saghyz]